MDTAFDWLIAYLGTVSSRVSAEGTDEARRKIILTQWPSPPSITRSLSKTFYSPVCAFLPYALYKSYIRVRVNIEMARCLILAFKLLVLVFASEKVII